MLNEHNFVSESYIKDLMAASKVQSYTFFGKCTVVAMQLPNGYVIVESTGCIDPKNYDKEIGKKICLEQIEHRLWQLEGYVGSYEFADKKTCQ